MNEILKNLKKELAQKSEGRTPELSHEVAVVPDEEASHHFERKSDFKSRPNSPNAPQAKKIVEYVRRFELF